MLKPVFFSAVLMLGAIASCLLTARPVCADSIRLLADLEETDRSSSTTNKETGITEESSGSGFSQLYNLDMSKEISTSLVLNGGGMFQLEDNDNESAGSKTTSREEKIRPFAELQLIMPILRAATGYRKGEIKQSATNVNTTTRYTEEYNTVVNWKPVDLPQVGLTYTRNLAYDEPATTDSVSEVFELKSRYDYKDFKFDYNHITNETEQKISASKTTINSDNGAVRYRRRFFADKASVSASIRYDQDKAEFSGTEPNRVPTSSPGTSFFNLDDPPPATSNDADNFESGGLTNINLLETGIPKQLSFGLDFGTATRVDTLFINLITATTDNQQATPTEIDSIDHLFSWSVMISDDQETWTNITMNQVTFNVFENRFEVEFTPTETRYIKIVTTPLPQSQLPDKTLFINQLEAKETLPPETSKFSRTNLITDLAANWQMSAVTASGYDLRYQEENSKPFNDKKSTLSAGANLRHIFNPVFTGRTIVNRSEVRKQGDLSTAANTFSASLAGKYLETFDQTLTYSFTQNKDAALGRSTSNSLLLRNNLDLYDGWSMNLDNGYSLAYPAEGGKRDSIFARLGSSIIPNRWMNLTLLYGISWTDETDKPAGREQNGSMFASWNPLSSLSMSADLSFVDRQGSTSESNTRQAYSINWSPFRDGDLQFSLTYGEFQSTEDEMTSSLSPSIKWRINRNSLLTVTYSQGEREDINETGDFENTTVSLRIFY